MGKVNLPYPAAFPANEEDRPFCKAWATYAWWILVRRERMALTLAEWADLAHLRWVWEAREYFVDYWARKAMYNDPLEHNKGLVHLTD